MNENKINNTVVTNILLAEYSGMKVFTGSTKDKDFDQKIKECDLCQTDEDTIVFSKGNKSGSKYNPFYNSNQADFILDKIASEQKGCIFLIKTPSVKNERFSFSLGCEIDRKENQHFVSTDVIGFGSSIKTAKYDFMVKYAKISIDKGK